MRRNSRPSLEKRFILARMNEHKPRDAVRPAPRWALTLFPGLHALIFLWGAAVLPYRAASSVFILLMLVGCAHLVAALSASFAERFVRRALRIAAFFSIAAFVYPAFEIMRSAAYLSALYGDLGKGVGVVLLVMLAPLALVTLPMAFWSLAITRKGKTKTDRRRRDIRASAIALIGLVMGALLLNERADARAEPLPQIAVDASKFGGARGHDVHAILLEAKREILDEASWSEAETTLRARRLFKRTAFECVPLAEDERAVASLLFFSPHPKGRGARLEERCLRASPNELARMLFETIRNEALPQSPVKIDLYRASARLERKNAIVETFAIRPGVDGVCNAKRCLMPWQLIALSELSVNQPISFIPDLHFGVSPLRLRRLLGETSSEALGTSLSDALTAWEERGMLRDEAPRELEPLLTLEGLIRLETESFILLGSGELLRLVRGKEPEVPLERRDEALKLAEKHIADAQRSDGFFRYRLDPHTGREHSGWSLPRQAGTTLVVCELGQDEEQTERVASRSIDLMLRDAKAVGDFLALGSGHRFNLGETALPLIAIYSCLERGIQIDRQKLAGLTRFVIGLQRDSGGFHPAYAIGTGIIEGPEPLYAGGQAVFALTLAERFVAQSPEEAERLGLPSREELFEAVERAMNYYARDYWPRFIRELFFLEENWHCLAARASLTHHRNEDYERFCLDYVRFKSRLVLDRASRVAPELIGGHSFGNLIVPSNTPTAGLGEALAAAMAIKEARGEDLARDKATMRLILGYLLRQQWTPRNCFACTTQRTVIGGFSEAITIPEVRIDYTQHAWAALGHGGKFVSPSFSEGNERVPASGAERKAR